MLWFIFKIIKLLCNVILECQLMIRYKINKLKLINSKLCFGPMSKNIVDTLIDFSNETKYLQH